MTALRPSAASAPPPRPLPASPGPQASLRSVVGALPRLTPAQVRAANMLHTGARSLTFHWLGQPLRLVRQRAASAGPWQLQLRLGGHGATLGLDGLQALMPGLDPLVADGDPALQAALFAQLAAGLWAALGLDGPEPVVQVAPLAAPSTTGTTTGSTTASTTASTPAFATPFATAAAPASAPLPGPESPRVPAAAPELAIGLQLHNLRCGARSGARLVFDSPAAAAAFGAAWARLAGPPAAPPADLPLALRFEVGSRRLAPAELRGLRPGDLVLLARLPSRGGRWQARILAGAGRSCIGLGHVKGDGIVMEQWQAPQSPASAAAAAARPANGLLEGVSVEVGFEIGHHRMALGELMQLAPGHVFALGANPEGDAVDLVVDGRVIGAGQLVLVGEALGVRVLRLQLEASAPAAARDPGPAGAAAAAGASGPPAVPAHHSAHGSTHHSTHHSAPAGAPTTA